MMSMVTIIIVSFIHSVNVTLSSHVQSSKCHLSSHLCSCSINLVCISQLMLSLEGILGMGTSTVSLLA